MSILIFHFCRLLIAIFVDSYFLLLSILFYNLHLNSTTVFLNAAGGINYLLPQVFGLNIVLMSKAGYTFDIFRYEDWNYNGIKVKNVPELSSSGFFIKLSFGIYSER